MYEQSPLDFEVKLGTNHSVVPITGFDDNSYSSVTELFTPEYSSHI